MKGVLATSMVKFARRLIPGNTKQRLHVLVQIVKAWYHISPESASCSALLTRSLLGTKSTQPTSSLADLLRLYWYVTPHWLQKGRLDSKKGLTGSNDLANENDNSCVRVMVQEPIVGAPSLEN